MVEVLASVFGILVICIAQIGLCVRLKRVDWQVLNPGLVCSKLNVPGPE